MSTTTRDEPRPFRAQAVSHPRRRPRKARNTLRRASALLILNSAEASLWARLEEREEGRIAQEADHLFDTSYSWAT